MRRKPIDDIEEENKHSGLIKSLGLWQLTAIGVGGIIGVGIFSLAGLVAHGSESEPGVGPAVLFSFLIAGLASAAAALSYAEFAGMIPRAGSAYTYGYVALGEIIGWFIGWDLLLEYIAIVAVVAIGISGYFDAFLSGIGINMPVWMTSTPDEGHGGIINMPAIARLPAGDLDPLPRHQDLWPVRADRRRHQGVADPVHHRPGRLLHQHQNYNPFYAQRLRSGGGRFRHGVLRGVRLRRHEYRGGRGHGRQEAHAQGDHPVPDHRHAALCRGHPGAHRHAELSRRSIPRPASPPPSTASGCR